MKVVTVTAAVRAERGIQSDHGALIYDIPDEMQQATGLRSGDVILQINRVRVSSVDDLRRAFATAAGAGGPTAGVRRGGGGERGARYGGWGGPGGRGGAGPRVAGAHRPGAAR